MNILCIAYLWNPVAEGMPAVQRVRRWMNNLKNHRFHILTLQSDRHMHFHPQGPLQPDGDTVWRAGSYGVTDLLEGLWRGLHRLVRKKDELSTQSLGRVSTPSAAPEITGAGLDAPGLKSLLKHVLYYPDYARPWILPAVRLGRRVIASQNIDVILATGSPWSSLLVGAVLRRLMNVPLVVDFRDPWARNPYQAHGRILRHITNALERFVVSSADAVLANTPSLRASMVAAYPRWANKIYLHMNGYDAESLGHIKAITLVSGKFIILHAGNLYAKRNPEMFFQALALAAQQRARFSHDVLFVQVGVVDKKTLLDMAKVYGLASNVMVKDFVARDLCLSWSAGASVLLVLQPGTMTQIPSKIFEYMCLTPDKLVICDQGSDLDILSCEIGLGEVVASHDVPGMAQSILRLYDAWASGKKLSSPITAQRFDSKRQAEELDALLTEIVTRRNRR